MADYTRQIERAKRSIKRQGEACKYIRHDQMVSDTPWEDVGVVQARRLDVYIAFPPIGQQSLYRSGTTVGKGGYIGLMGNYGFEPSLKDWVERGMERISIKDVIQIKINEQNIYFQISFNR